MKRYFLYFKNGEMTQQDGLNITYMHIHSLGLISIILDTTTGEIILPGKWEWQHVPEYHDSELRKSFKPDA